MVAGYYQSQRSWAKVIFSQACVCPQGGGVSASVHAGIPTHLVPPPGADPPSRPPLEQAHPPDQAHTPGSKPPGSRYPPGADTPRTRHTPPQSRHSPDQAPPPPELVHPREQTPPPRPGTPPESRLQHTVNERPVCILLECILVKACCGGRVGDTIPTGRLSCYELF